MQVRFLIFYCDRIVNIKMQKKHPRFLDTGQCITPF